MDRKPKESDWKAFRKIVPELRERYLVKKNEAIIEIFTDQNRTPTEQFWDARELIEKVRKALQDCLDGHSRSQMEWYMFLMYGHGMLTDSDLGVFSAELQKSVKNCVSKAKRINK